ncbi:LamG domain-containing protein [Botrimarina mediterranea]|uniref:LamG domain-containing protein n=1 Tax=Botrimarina mediterranea TaxID=2528022 RepID=UPI001189D22A|nr:hypothetical protein K2D_17800 [Planctomycetes bacterium K2D]
MIRYAALLLALLAGALHAPAANVLLVTGAGALTGDESDRRLQMQSWGHTVTTIVDSDSQANFDAALANVDAVYIPVTVQEWDLSTKLKSTTKGVVCEERYMDVNLGFSTALGWNNNYTQTEVLSNSHPVTSGLPTGYVTIVSSSQPLALMNDTIAPGMMVLSKQNLAAGNMLGVIDAGGALAGGGYAAGRRVRLPWGGDSFNIYALNSYGAQIGQQAIAWAATKPGPRLHWRLDETGGSTVNDSSGNNRHGAITGSMTWVDGRRNGGVDIASGAKATVSSLLGEPTSFTVAAWVDCDAVGAAGGVALSVGDHIALVMDEPTNGGRPAIAFNHSGSSFRWSSGGAAAVGGGWRHYVGVFDDAANTLKLYIDGVLVATTNTTDSIDWAANIGATTAVGGTSYPIASYNLDGRVDDVRVYGRALSESEIAEVYGLIAHWKLDESSGATANDSSLANNDAIRTGTVGWTAAKDANGHSFYYPDGEEYFTAPTNTTLNDVQEGDYTVMAYFKPNSTPPGTGSANDSTYTVVAKEGWHSGLLYNNAGEFQMDHWRSGDIWSGVGTDGEVYAPGTFHHVAGVVNRTAGTVKVYVDGVLKNTTNFTPGAAAREYGSAPWRIGVGEPGGYDWGYPCDGVIDDVRIYNRAVTDEELAAFASPGLVGHWRLDETSGTTAVDSSSTGNDGTYTGGVTLNESGPYPGDGAVAADFDGADDAVEVPNESLYDITGPITVAAWFKIDAFDHHFQTIIAKGDSAWRISRDASTNFLHFACTGLSHVSLYGDIEVNDGAWHHVAGVYDGSEIRLYVDGRLDVSHTSTGSISTNDHPVTIGRNAQVSQRNWEGGLFDARVYNVALSHAEIAELHGLVGQWKLDETSGTVATDSSGKARHGTYQGSPTLAAAGPGSGSLAASFDGVDDRVSLPTIDDTFENGVTIAGWMRPTAAKNFAKLMQLSIGTSNAIDLGRRGTSSDLRGIVDPGSDHVRPGALHDNAWRHYTMTMDPSGEMRLYRNGVLLGSATRAPVPIAVRTTNWIGASSWGSDEFFEGQMHDVRLYNRPLSDDEATALYLGANVYPSVRIVRWEEAANP